MAIKLGATDVSLRQGSGAADVYLGTRVASRLLDVHGNATAAFSLRLLRSAYDGPLVRVRRSSDSDEADFNESEINGGSLASWVGSGNDGFVRTLYDQTGNDRHMNQTTAGRQPKLVSSGAVILEEGKPTLEFATARDDFLTTGNIGVNVPVDAYMVARFRTLSSKVGTIAALLGKSGVTSGLFIRVIVAGPTVQAGNTATLYNDVVYANTTRRIWNAYFDSGANSLFFVDATQVAAADAGTNNPTGFALGTDAELPGRTGDVNIQEAVFYGASQVRRSGIRSAINSYYSVF